jgi:urea transport system ATP-binding protein
MMLQIDGLNQFYGGSHTLWDVGMEVTAGSCLCLMGRNGVGKTTLLKCIMGLIPIHNGKVNFMGEAITHFKPEQRAGLGIGYVPQGRDIFPLLTVEENLKIGLRAARKHGINKIPEHIFDIFPVLKQMLNRRGGDLSGGQQQQLTIGRALVFNPKLLILDEPTEGIQPNIVSEIGDVIIRLNKAKGINTPLLKTGHEARDEVREGILKIKQELGVTILIVEQKLHFARKVADRFCIMDRGRDVADGVMGQLNEEMVKRYLTV